MNTYTTIRLSKDLHQRLKALAETNHRTMTMQLEYMVYYFSEQRAEPITIKADPKDYNALLKKRLK